MKKKINNILLVDDDIAANFLNKKLLEKLDCAERIINVYDGKKALDYLLSDECNTLPNLILLDINMPNMNGWEFMEEYQKLNNYEKNNTIIIMLTTSLNPSDLDKAKSIPEINEFLNKPITFDKINKILEKYFAEFI